MIANGAVRNLIRKGEDHQLYTAIGTGRSEGMITMEQSLADLVVKRRVHADVALAGSSRRQELTESHGLSLER